MSRAARVTAGYLLRALQAGRTLAMPHSRPLPAIGLRCHELRIVDGDVAWRIIHRVDDDAIVILEGLPQDDAEDSGLGDREMPDTIEKVRRKCLIPDPRWTQGRSAG